MQPYIDQEAILPIPQRFSISLLVSIPLQPSTQNNHCANIAPWIFVVVALLIKSYIIYSFEWLSLCIVFMRLIHICSDRFLSLLYFIVWIQHNIHLTFNGHLGSLKVWAITKNAAVNISVHVLCVYICVVLSSFCYRVCLCTSCPSFIMICGSSLYVLDSSPLSVYQILIRRQK